MAGVWSDLPADLINKIGEFFVRSNDLDYYSSLRAVCLNWRVATEPPNFFLNNWIMLEKASDQKVSFLNILTGRVCEKCIPNDLLRFVILCACYPRISVIRYTALYVFMHPLYNWIMLVICFLQ